MTATFTTEQACLNCRTERTGPYCQACGQRAVDPGALSIGRLLTTFTQELPTLDFKTLRSLPGLASPGFLTREYLEGRQRPYLNPLKVYFLCAATFFLAAPIAGFNFEAFMHQDNRGVFRQIVEARMKARQMDEALFAERFNLHFQTVYTLGVSVSIASATLLLALSYRRQRRPFGAHAVFGLHYVGFLYVAAIAIGALSRALTLRPGGTLLLAYVLIGPYLVIALRRVYAQPIGRTLAKALALASVGFIVDGTVNLAALALTIWLV